MAAILARASGMNSPAYAKAGGCQARPLPLDGTCPGVARRLFREAVADLGPAADVVHDGVTMVTGLAANTPHAPGNGEFYCSRAPAAPGSPATSSHLPRG